ncbi:polysaccharide deacetylase family protein [Candidatus Nitrosotenuis chungbukensis]|uniref:polysaccharide deacetylase family protein n=1 Tax=Candidatus Nitrosotenuis chungbukensis TaxID=1353246 RepID=UPI00267190EB|nr:polysaccharide deacetylase family protein [Candidatus Nitrosotenuis chungbukensis]WKT57366.1 polysaccharide deacetylase family protein [Candidatus Nitrosotenuis chungbukensis]
MVFKTSIISLVISFLIFVPVISYQQNTGSVEVTIRNENGDRVTPDLLSVKVYQDFSSVPFKEITSLIDNPLVVDSLPLGHRYKFEVYMNSLYGDVAFVDLQKSQDKVEIVIKNPGGIRLSVFYGDGETPLTNADVWIKSFDGKSWGYSGTDESGQTLRMWLYPTMKDTDYYYAEIALGPDLKYVQTPVKLLPNVAQELKVVTQWPTVVDKLITIEVYNTTNTKVAKSDGEFIAQLYDGKKNKLADSLVSDKGLAGFAKLKVGTYAIHIKSKSSDGQLTTLASKKSPYLALRTFSKFTCIILKLNSEYLNCNCVAFRLDDIQDYFLNGAQIDIINMFAQKQSSLTLGVVANVFGDDPNLVPLVKNMLTDKSLDLEIANHSWTHRIMTALTKDQQADDFAKSNKKIHDVLGVTPTTFIPPENLYNDDTIAILKQNNFTQIGSHTSTSKSPPFQKSSLYYFPASTQTSILDRQEANWKVQSVGKVLDGINESLFNYGYAVVMMHPHEFSTYSDGIYQNKVNQTQVQQLGLLIDKVKSQGLKIVTIDKISSFDKPAPQKQPATDTPKEPLTCNCVAFRMDNIQDFYLNDVQNAAIGRFSEKNAQLTISVIGQFFGNDPKAVDLIKEKIQSKTTLRIANRGWEYVDHTAYDKEKQAASIKKTNDKIFQILQVKSVIFAPPLDSFNKETIEAANQNNVRYFSASIVRDPPPYADSLKHVPSTALLASLMDDDPFYAGTIPEKALTKIKSNISQNGYAVISLQSQDFAAKDGKLFKNEVDSSKLQLLDTILDDLKSSGISIVALDEIPSILENKSLVIPDTAKDNAGLWSKGQMSDSDFTKELKYLVEQKILQIPNSQISGEQKIPPWVKNIAGWWAEDKIGNADFVKGIQYLMEHGIIRI